MVRPLEVPVVTETKRLMGRGESGRAVRFAYPAALTDAARAFGWQLSGAATNRETLAVFTDQAPPHFVTHLARLYALYEPARYGRESPPLVEDPVQILLSLYSFAPMWMLYAQTGARPATTPSSGGKSLPAAPPPSDPQGG
ncbi:MAG: hypothetical protein L3K15_08615 [Thermoplasmata archaeon]|nr:hypothetical protein [Thermoplasmata archaeon]